MILVFGTVCLDRIRRIPALPGPGTYVEIESETTLLGGEAANTAAALTSWGADVRLFGNPLGEGPEADYLRALLEKRSLVVEAAGEPPPQFRTPVCDIYVTPDGDRTMFGLGFSAMEPVFDPALLPLTPGEWFTAEPNMGGVSRQAARAALGAGMKVYLMDFIRDDDPVAPGSIWQSSTDWAGFRGDVVRNTEWVRRLVDRTGCFAILSDGPNGLVAGSPELEVRAYPPFPSPPIVDTTGAGDMFRAAMLYGLGQDWPIGRSLAFAAASGSLSVRSLGATSLIASIDEINDLVSSHPGIAQEYRLA